MKPIFALALAVMTVAASAQSKTFTVVGDKLQYRNLATVESVADFETFTGRTHAVEGKIQFDPKTKKGSGTLIVDVSSIDTGIAARNDHLKGEMWLNTSKHSTATFKTVSVAPAGGNKYKVTGDFTLKGVTKRITTMATVDYAAAGAKTKNSGFSGDVLKVVTKFSVRMSDYGIKIPDMAAGKVSNDVTIYVSAYAVAN